MFSLLLKDLLPQLKSKVSWLSPLLIVVGCLFCHQGSSWGVYILFLPIYMLAIYSDGYDFKYNHERFFLSCPVARWQWVLSRYALVFLSLLATVALCFLFGGIGSALRLPISIPSLGFLSLLSLMTGLYFSVYYPFALNLGYGKSRWVNFLSIVLIGAMAGIVGPVSASGPMPKDGFSLGSSIARITQGGSVAFFAVQGALSIALLSVSFFIASALFRRRDF